jgi:MFS family permease
MEDSVNKDVRTTVANRLPFFYGWIIVTAGFFSSLSGGGTQAFTFGVFIKPMSESLGWSRSVMTAALTILIFASAVVAPIFGRIVDRYGPRPLIILTAIGGGVGTILLSSIREIWHLYLIFGLMGLSGVTGVGNVVTEASISKWFVRLRGRALALGTMGISMAGIVLAPLVGVVISLSGWREAWFLVSALFFILFCVAFLTARSPEDMGLLPDGAKNIEELDSAMKSGGGESAYPWSLKEAFKTRALWVLLASELIAGIPAVSVVVHLFSYITDEGFSVVTAATILSVNAASASVSRLVWGLLAERYNVRYCLSISYFGGALGLLILLIGLKISYWPMLFMFGIVYGLNVGGHVVLAPLAIAGYFGREFVGTIRGVFMAILTSSLAFAPLMLGLAYDIQGTYFNSFILMGVLFLTSTVLILFARSPKAPNVLSR